MTGVPDPYAALGVAPDATADEIKRAYRKLAREYHPDSTGGDKGKEARFKEISSAYGIIGDPEKRARYDAMKSASARGVPGGFPEGVFDLGDLFAQVFAGAGAARQGDPGFSYRVYTGNGQSGFDNAFGFGDLGFGFGGQAQRRKRPNRPKRPKRRKVTLSDGTTAEARGPHIYSDLRLSIDQAVMGTSVTVATLDGKATLRVPPGTSSGVKLRLRDKGVSLGGGQNSKRGDHFVTVHIDVPKKISDEAARLLVQFMKAAKD